jgi:hypothetical protein
MQHLCAVDRDAALVYMVLQAFVVKVRCTGESMQLQLLTRVWLWTNDNTTLCTYYKHSATTITTALQTIQTDAYVYVPECHPGLAGC